MLIYHLRTALMLVAIGLTLVAWWRIPPPRPRVFVLLGIIAALALPLEVFGYLTTLLDVNNSVAYNLFTWTEFLLVLGMVRSSHTKLRTATWVVAVVGTVGMIWDHSMVNGMYNMLIEGIMLMAFLLALLFALALWNMANTSTVALHRVPEFWLYMGMLAYFGGLPPVVAAARFVYTQDTDLVKTLWTIVPVLCTLRYLLAAHAAQLVGRQRRTQPHG